jgi:hypothetical protein
MAAMTGVNNDVFRPWGPVYHGDESVRLAMPDRARAAPLIHSNHNLGPYSHSAVNRFANGYPGRGVVVDNHNGRKYSTPPRYMGQTLYGRHRFRPLNRPGWSGYRDPRESVRYATNPYPVPNYQQNGSGWVPYNPVMPGRQPYMAMHYPGMHRPSMPNRYGVDWYDGMGDGEGAWYKLAGQQEWPRVSQYQAPD